jgi:protoheme IX farnesyltransferase
MQSTLNHHRIIRSSDHPVIDSSVRDWFTLLKPGVMSLVVFTGYAGLAVAPVHMHPFLQCIALFCIAVGSGAGAAINMAYDRDIDAVMLRTRGRPVAAGRIAPDDAYFFGLALAAFSVAMMGLATNWLAAGILAFAIFFYGVVYTMWLKRSTPQNIVIGGAAGAFPPMIGWAAATGNVTWLSLSLFLIIFLWTPPHFWALALYRNGDYRKANVPMLPVVRGLRETKRQMLLYTYALAAASFLPVFLHHAGILYTLAALALNFIFLLHARRVWNTEGDATARSMFGYSILYLFLLFGGLILDNWVDMWLRSGVILPQ